MPTRNVVLTNHQNVLVEQLVSSGRYQNASEVLREGLRLVERIEQENAARLRALQELVRAGDMDLEAGRYNTFETVAELEDHLDGLSMISAS
ncbi:MAG: type II toxin-antitoxin system ParD family antitoxin [Thermodesulfobacteriota bacterium]|nr:type II toxin-antitoxin system ParD family antitoxin [Thermodesulfobacteriota bacterium]